MRLSRTFAVMAVTMAFLAFAAPHPVASAGFGLIASVAVVGMMTTARYEREIAAEKEARALAIAALAATQPPKRPTPKDHP